jgi:hypothetical protein
MRDSWKQSEEDDAVILGAIRGGLRQFLDIHQHCGLASPYRTDRALQRLRKAGRIKRTTTITTGWQEVHREREIG